MVAIILAGGKGTRLKPFTTNFPKPLVPIGDVPILEIIIKQLRQNGFKKIIISTGHLAELIQAYFGDGSRWDIEIEYVREYVPLNTAGALKLINTKEENFLVMNGDILTDLNYAKFLEDHITRGDLASIALAKRESKIDFGVLYTDDKGYLNEYVEKPIYDFHVSMGVYCLSKKALSYIEEGEPLSMPDLMLRLKANQHPVYCFNAKCYWLDIGRVDDYEIAQDEFLKNQDKFLTGS